MRVLAAHARTTLNNAQLEYHGGIRRLQEAVRTDETLLAPLLAGASRHCREYLAHACRLCLGTFTLEHVGVLCITAAVHLAVSLAAPMCDTGHLCWSIPPGLIGFWWLVSSLDELDTRSILHHSSAPRPCAHAG